MSKMPLFVVVMVAIIVVAASFRYVQQRRETRDNQAAPLLQKRVVVSHKQEQVPGFRQSQQRQTAPAGSTVRYQVTFKPQSSEPEVTFRLDANQYHQLTVGEKGTLSYKGTQFVAFVAD